MIIPQIVKTATINARVKTSMYNIIQHHEHQVILDQQQTTILIRNQYFV